MLEPAARDQHPGVGQRLDDRLVGVAFVALFGEHALAGKTWRLRGEAAVLIDGIGNGRGDAALGKRTRIRGPDVEILAAVAGRGMHETGAGVLGHVIAGQQRNVEPVTVVKFVQRMPADDRPQLCGVDASDLFERRHPRLAQHIERQPVRQNEEVAGFRPVVGRRVGDFVETVFDARRIADRAIARNRPRRRRPDDDARVLDILSRFRGLRPRRRADRKLHPYRVRGIILILDLGFGERGLFHHRPHHRLRAAIERAVRGEFHELARDLCLGGVTHGAVIVVPVADHAEPFEFGPLHRDPVRGERPALLAEFNQGRRVRKVRLRLAFGAIVLFLDLPFDRQAVTVPPRHVIGIEAEHLLAFCHHVLENLVERGADMDVAVGIGRAVMKDKARPAFGGGAKPSVKVEASPAGQQLRLFLRQAGAHREVCPRQEQRLAVIARGVGFLVHARLLTSPRHGAKGTKPATGGARRGRA